MTLSIVHSIGGTTAALRQMIVIMIVMMIMISLNITSYKEPRLKVHCIIFKFKAWLLGPVWFYKSC